MKIEIIAKVKINFEDPTKTDVLVRKVVRDDDDHIIGVCGLSKDGEWLSKEVGSSYPPDCHLPVIIYDNYSPMAISE